LVLDVVCGTDTLYIACRSTNQIYSLNPEKDGVGLKAEPIICAPYPPNIVKLSDIWTSEGTIYVAVSGVNGGIFHFRNDTWTVLLTSSNDLEVHGLVHVQTSTIFTDPAHHKVYSLGDDGTISEWAGSGVLGDVDGPAQHCRFGQITGICIEREKNIYIVDTQNGSVKMLTDPKPTAKFLQQIGHMCRSFGMHRKGTHSIDALLDVAVHNTSGVNEYIQTTVSKVQDEVHKVVTNGPDGTISAKTKSSVHILSTGVTELQVSMNTINQNYSVAMQSCLTTNVESLHSLSHLKNNDLPHMLEHARSFGNTMKESLKRISRWSAHYHTKPSSYYLLPDNQNRL
jgi:hypothetical protein